MDRSVSLADVARLSGVSRATASRALNGRDGVRPDVRDRVMLVAQSLRYRPNRAARTLASGRSSVIGLVIESEELRVDPYGASMVHSVARAADAADHGLMLLLAASTPGEAVTHNLRDGLIDGLIVSAVSLGRTWVDDLLDSPVPTLLIGSHPSRPHGPSVDTEHRASAAAAVEHLFDQGCERVAIITGRLERVDAAARLAGYRDAHRRRGVAVDESLVVSGDFTRQSGQLAAEDRLTTARPDGLFASNDEMALGAISVFERLGWKIPGDIAVIGFDGTFAAEQLGVSLSSVRQPFGEMAQLAVADLIAHLDVGQPLAQRVVEPELIIGESSLRRQHTWKARPPPAPG